MRERAQMQSGTLELRSRPGAGFAIKVSFKA
jgi:signal transduction histidine kinase